MLEYLSVHVSLRNIISCLFIKEVKSGHCNFSLVKPSTFQHNVKWEMDLKRQVD